MYANTLSSSELNINIVVVQMHGIVTGAGGLRFMAEARSVTAVRIVGKCQRKGCKGIRRFV